MTTAAQSRVARMSVAKSGVNPPLAEIHPGLSRIALRSILMRATRYAVRAGLRKQLIAVVTTTMSQLPLMEKGGFS